jgi:phage terminase small subunit
MPLLDPKDEIICRAYVANGSNQVEAWRVGNPDSKAIAKTQHEKASRFFSQGKVKARIAELHLEVVQQSIPTAALTLETHLEKLRELRDEAKSLNQMSAAITVEKLRGEAMRFYVKQVETAATSNTATHAKRGATPSERVRPVGRRQVEQE